MKVLITGAAGMIGRKLAARLAGDAALNGTPIDHMLLVDVGRARAAPAVSPDASKRRRLIFPTTRRSRA